MQTEDRQVTKKPQTGTVQLPRSGAFEMRTIIAMSIFEYDKEEEEQKLQATYEKIGEKRGEKQGELKKAKSIAISLAQEGESCRKNSKNPW